MFAMFGAAFVAVFVVASLFSWRGAIPTITQNPDSRRDKRPDSETAVDGPGEMLIRRLRYLLRQNTEERVLTVIAGTDAPTEVSEPVEDDGKNLAIVSEEPGIPSSVDTQTTPPEGDAGTEGEVSGSTAVTLCL